MAGIGPLVAAAMVLAGLPPREARGAGAGPRRLDFRPVLANREARRYIFGYAVHCWELFGSRSWMVAFLTFAQTLVPAPLSPAAIHALANLGCRSRASWATKPRCASGARASSSTG